MIVFHPGTNEVVDRNNFEQIKSNRCAYLFYISYIGINILIMQIKANYIINNSKHKVTHSLVLPDTRF